MDFTSFCSLAPPTVKKVKLELFNSFDDDTMSTIVEAQIPFLSLRQKYGVHSQGIEFPLPKKYSQLLDFLGSIEMNYLKNQCQIQFTIESNMAEIVQISQLLSLEPSLYRIKIIKTGIVIQHPFHKNNDIKKDLPNIIKERIKHIRQKLHTIVQDQHKIFLIHSNCLDFEQFSQQFKIYHNDFDLNDMPDIIPVKLKKNVFQKELIQIYKNILDFIIEQYDKKSVSFMFQEHLINILSINFNKVKSEIENLLKNLMKLIPDRMQIIKNHINQSRWMIQLDRKMGNSDILNKFLYI